MGSLLSSLVNLLVNRAPISYQQFETDQNITSHLFNAVREDFLIVLGVGETFLGSTSSLQSAKCEFLEYDSMHTTSIEIAFHMFISSMSYITSDSAYHEHP